MNAREERGLVIAALCKLNRSDRFYLVPSQSCQMMYKVSLENQTCACPDHVESGNKCKHIYAVEFMFRREVLPNGQVQETRSVTFTEKKTYPQNWPAYNAAQACEKDRFQVLLCELCGGVKDRDAR